MPVERVETLVIGGGQAGLVMSHRLKQRGLSHLVLERQRVAERWRSERWDGLAFQFPNWSVRLPDFPFPHTDPDAFATTDEIIKFIDAYAEFVAPPIRCGVEVTRLRARVGASGFIAETAGGTIEADQCRRRYRSLSARADPGPAARPSGVPGPCLELPQSGTASVRRGAGGRRRRIGGADRRRAAARRTTRLSFGRHPPPAAAPLPRPRRDLVDIRDGHRPDPDRAARGVGAGPGNLGCLWRTDHRLPPLRRRRHDTDRAFASRARRRDRDRTGPCRKHGGRRSHLQHFPRPSRTAM